MHHNPEACISCCSPRRFLFNTRTARSIRESTRTRQVHMGLAGSQSDERETTVNTSKCSGVPATCSFTAVHKGRHRSKQNRFQKSEIISCSSCNLSQALHRHRTRSIVCVSKTTTSKRHLRSEASPPPTHTHLIAVSCGSQNNCPCHQIVSENSSNLHCVRVVGQVSIEK